MSDKLISLDDVKRVLDSADTALHECFDMLIGFCHAQNNIEKTLLRFQPMLAETLLKLMEFYNSLSQEKNTLISQKDDYPQDAFSQKMARNARFAKAVSMTIEIGKSMGDAFAWFFYRDNREDLDKHFKHEPVGLYVSGIGGRGELEFIKNSLSLDGFYVLYHGITTMLRIGDFSLYDFNRGIVGLGELKTRKIGDKLNVSAFITAKKDIQVKNQPQPKSSSLEEELKYLEKEFPRIEKQIKSQIEFLKQISEHQSATLQTAYEYNMLDSLTPQNRFALSSDRSLMLVGTWSKYNTLYEVLTEEEEFSGLPEGTFVDDARSMIVPELQYNQFHVGELTTKITLMEIPILWWNINDKICEDVYFKRVSIATVFNPARFLDCFIKDGFSVVKIGNLDEIELEKKINDKVISFGNFQSFCFMITNSLMKTQSVYESIKYVVDETEMGKFPPNTRIDLNIHLDNFNTGLQRKNGYDRKETSDGQTENAHAE